MVRGRTGTRRGGSTSRQQVTFDEPEESTESVEQAVETEAEESPVATATGTIPAENGKLDVEALKKMTITCLLYTSPSPRD